LTNEEFQNLVIKELGSIKDDVSSLKEGQTRIENRLEKVESKIERVENRLEKVETKLDAVHEQTAILTEFRTDTNMKLDYLLEQNTAMHEIIGRHEIAITMLKRKAV
jgi:archaellum component FlaC